MNNNVIIFSVVVAVSIVGGWYFADSNTPVTADVEKSNVNVIGTNTNNGPVASVASGASRSIASVPTAASSPKMQTAYMKTLMKESASQKVFARSKDIFKNLPQGESLAKWITLGLRLDSSKEFGDEFNASLAELNQNPGEVLEAIASAYPKLGNEDSFIQSMLINVVHQLQVSKDEKVTFYSERITDKFVLDQAGEPTASSLNVSNSLAFLRQYMDNGQAVKEKIAESLSEHRDDKRTQKELAERFTAYFPDLKNDINKWSDQ